MTSEWDVFDLAKNDLSAPPYFIPVIADPNIKPYRFRVEPKGGQRKVDELSLLSILGPNMKFNSANGEIGGISTRQNFILGPGNLQPELKSGLKFLVSADYIEKGLEKTISTEITFKSSSSENFKGTPEQAKINEQANQIYTKESCIRAGLWNETPEERQARRIAESKTNGITEDYLKSVGLLTCEDLKNIEDVEIAQKKKAIAKSLIEDNPVQATFTKSTREERCKKDYRRAECQISFEEMQKVLSEGVKEKTTEVFVPFGCLGTTSEGCKSKLPECPKGKRLTGIKVACNLELGDVSAGHYRNLKWNTLSLERMSLENESSGVCGIAETSISGGGAVFSGSFSFVGASQYRTLYLEDFKNPAKNYWCSIDYKNKGSACVVRGDLRCQ